MCKRPSEEQVHPRAEAHLQRPEDLWVVVDVPQGGQGMLVLLELCKGVAERLTLHFPKRSFEVSHHPTLKEQEKEAMVTG